MSRCLSRCCSRCCNEIHLESIAQNADAKRKDACSIGPMPEISHDSEEDLVPDVEDEPISVEEGDWILATGLLPTLTGDICASSTISQRLAEAFQANTEAVSPVLEYLKESTSMFSKQSFDDLPEPKEWDHTVELVRGSPYGPTLHHSSIRFNTIVIRSNHLITTLHYSLCPWHLPNSFYLQIVPDHRAYLRVRAWPYG